MKLISLPLELPAVRTKSIGTKWVGKCCQEKSKNMIADLKNRVNLHFFAGVSVKFLEITASMGRPTKPWAEQVAVKKLEGRTDLSDSIRG